MDEDRATLERFRIHERIHLYQDLLNHRDWERYQDLWTEDGIFSQTISEGEEGAGEDFFKKPANVNLRREGRAAIMELLGGYVRFDFLFQMVHGTVVELDDERNARARHTLHIFGQAFNMLGIYYDRLVKEDDGVWRFSRRDFRVTYFDGTPAGGQTYRKMPDPRYLTMPGA